MSATTTPTATLDELLADLKARGITLSIKGDHLAFRPREAVDERMFDRLRRAKPDLMAALSEQVKTDCRACLKMIIRSLSPDQEPALDAILAAWKRRLDMGRNDGEPIATYERAALDAANQVAEDMGVLP